MPIPIEQVVIYSGSGGIIMAVAMKILPLLFKRINGNGNGRSRNNGSDLPGTAQVCIDRGEKLAAYDVILEHLGEGMDENKAAHKEIIKKLDALK